MSLFPCPQATNAAFRLPPLHTNLSLSEIHEFHRRNNPEHPLFRYDTDGGIQTLTWAKAGRGIDHVAGQLPPATPTVVAVLAVLGAYFSAF